MQPESLPFQFSIPVLLVLSTATMAYIQYNCDRLLKLNDSITTKLESLDEKTASKSIIKQSQKTQTLYDEALVSTPP